MIAARTVSGAGSLPWGRHYLLCAPVHFGVLYEINPWMHQAVTVDVDAATSQWQQLRDTLIEAGATVETIDQPEGVPDLVFTANAGLLDSRSHTFVPSHFRHPERQPETDVFADWFSAAGWNVHRLPADIDHEGAGDALPFGDVLVSGYRFRSDAAAASELTGLLDVAVRPVELVDERLYHLDLTFCPLDDRRAMCAPMGWDSYGRKVIEALVPEPLWLDDDEALAFVANSVVVGATVVMPSCPPRIGRQLETWGFDVAVCPVDEFLKAGGGCRCLTLALDVPLGS
jgi:N-dimethylarginine dimethylaminohydrolase